MEIFYDDVEEFEVYRRDYFPSLVKNGFGERMFPNLKIYLEKKYDTWQDGINTNREHFVPSEGIIYSNMITYNEWKQTVPLSREEYDRIVIGGKVSSLPHEIGHYIHFDKFGEDNSLMWQKAGSFMHIELDFSEISYTGYWYKPAYEKFANYFESCIEGRTKDELFMDFVRELYGIKVKVLGNNEYKIIDGRAYAPLRLVTETFQDRTLRDIVWLETTKEVVVVSAENGY